MSNATALARPLDWSRAADWSDSIADGQLEPVRRAFRKAGASGPDVTWTPDETAVGARPLRALLRYWAELRQDGSLPLADRIDPLGMRDALGYVMLVDVVEQGRDFRYRLYGSTLAAVSGFDMTGRLLSTHAASAHILEFSLALYRAVLKRREPAFSQYAPGGTMLTAQWQRIALPLVDRSGAIVRFLSGTVPVGRDGRIVSTRL